MFKNRIAFYILLLEGAIILFLIYYIKVRKRQPIVNPLSKKTIEFVKGTKLQYFYEPKPSLTLKDYTNFSGFLPEYTYTITINKDSLNERFDYSPNKGDDTYRIITLGDSFTYGLFVDTKRNWTEVLEDRLNQESLCKNISRFEIINLGVEGYDIEYSVERFKRRGLKYNPDLLIWYLKEDDFAEIMDLMFAKLEQYSKDMKKSGEYDRWIAKGMFYPEWLKAQQDIDTLLGENGILEFNAKKLSSITDYFKDLLLLVAPLQNRSTAKKFIAERPRSYLLSKLSYLNDKANLLPDNQHPNIDGHRLIAEDIFNYMKQNKLIPCD